MYTTKSAFKANEEEKGIKPKTEVVGDDDAFEHVNKRRLRRTMLKKQ